MADDLDPTPPPGEGPRQPGLPGVLLAAGLAVAAVLGAAVVTALLPREGQDVVFHTPLLIAVLIGGTALVLLRILRAPGR